MLNLQLMRHPLNWLIVGLMLTIIGIAGHLVLTHFGAEPAGPAQVATLEPGEESAKEVAQSVLG